MRELEKQTDNLIEFAKEQCEIFPEDSAMGRYLRETLKMLQAEPCEDAVSRKKIEKLKRWRLPYDTNTTIPKSDLFVKLTDIRELPPVKPVACIAKVNFSKEDMQEIVDKKVEEITVEPRWIPVSERLPENETRVLTAIKIPNRIARVRSGWYDSGFIHNDNGGFFHNDNGDVWKATDMEVLAWMPLPEPYKESEEE